MWITCKWTLRLGEVLPVFARRNRSLALFRQRGVALVCVLPFCPRCLRGSISCQAAKRPLAPLGGGQPLFVP